MDAAAMDAVASDAAARPSSQVASAPAHTGGRLSGWLSHFRRSGPVREIATDEDALQQPASAWTADGVSGVGSDDFFQTVETDDDRHWKPLIDPMKVIGGIGRSWKLIALCTVLGALLGVAVAVSTPKKYVAATELLIDPRDLKLVDRDLTQAGFSNEATLAIVENQVRVITSGTVLNQVVDTLHLDEDPEFNGQGGSRGLLSGLRSALSGDKGADDAGRRRALAVNNLAESLSVERGGKTFVVVIAREDTRRREVGPHRQHHGRMSSSRPMASSSRTPRPGRRKSLPHASPSCATASRPPSARSRPSRPSTTSSTRRAG